MSGRFLPLGKFLSTHGLRGDLRFELHCDGVDFASQFRVLRVDGRDFEIENLRPFKSLALIKLKGIDGVTAAQALRGKIAEADMSGVVLPEGRYFIQDLIGLSVLCGGEKIGEIADVFASPASDIYVVRRADGTETMIPNVPAFVGAIDLDEKTVEVMLIDGM